DGVSWSTIVEEDELVDAAGSGATTSAIGAMTSGAGRSTLEMLTMVWLSIVEIDKVIHTVETDIVKLVVTIKSFGMSFDKFDEETGSSNGLQPKQADLSYSCIKRTSFA
nr:hypothetical protein [Tanacetum cinerariifolium]